MRHIVAAIDGRARHPAGGCTLSKQTPRPAAVASEMGQFLTHAAIPRVLMERKSLEQEVVVTIISRHPKFCWHVRSYSWGFRELWPVGHAKRLYKAATYLNAKAGLRWSHHLRVL
jgi:hypothetical protein